MTEESLTKRILVGEERRLALLWILYEADKLEALATLADRDGHHNVADITRKQSHTLQNAHYILSR